MTYTIQRTRQRTILRHHGRVIGIYRDHTEAQRGADLDRRQRTMSRKIKVKYDFEGEIELDDDLYEALVEDLKKEGVTGTPTEKEIETSLKNLVSDDPEGIVPDADDLISQVKVIGYEGEPIEIEEETP